MPRYIKKKSEEVLSENPWWKYKHDKYTFPDGSEGDYYYGENNGSAMVIPILDDGRLVLVSLHRYLSDKPSIEFPCGGIEKDEVPQAAAFRELREETGWQSDGLSKVGSFIALNGLFKDETHLFVANNLEQISGPSSEPGEVTEVMYRRPDELEDMIKRGEIWDGQTLAAWSLAREFIRSNTFRNS